MTTKLPVFHHMFQTLLKLLCPALVVVGVIHLTFGAGGEVLLGAAVDPQFLNDPVIDSQNRFYGVAFTVYGFLFYLCATDLPKYETVLKILLAVFFAAGLARIVSIGVVGLPSVMVLFLLFVELVMPPVLYVWLRMTIRSSEK